MKILFVRHGHPNYKEDCLTELGHLQAEAAGHRLANETVDQIYASTCGRARETAEHIAQVRGVAPTEIIPLEFMREIKWGSVDGEEIYQKGHPWVVSGYMVRQGISVTAESWKDCDLFQRNKVMDSCRLVQQGFDELLRKYGYQREGEYYRVAEGSQDTIMVVSHAGSSSAVLSHIFNLPLPFLFTSISPYFTAVTEVELSGEVGELITPAFLLVNDARHVKGIEVPNVIDN